MQLSQGAEIVRVGLSEGEVQKRLEQFGENVLPQGRKESAWSMFVSQFKSPLVYVILAAALVSLVMGEVKDFAIIAIVVIFDVILGFLQEYGASKTYESLKSLIKPVAVVIREGIRKEVPVRKLVPGDIVIVTAGDKVPADGTVIDSVRLSTNEAILTGESESVRKKKDDTLFMGSVVVAGHGEMIVTKTGASTELGKIASSLEETPDAETPLQKRLADFSKTLTRLVIGISLGIFIVGVLRGKPALEMVRVAIILAIAAIPEGLLIAVTVILVLGMKRVLKRKGLVKRLLAVETLGSVTTICTDKTGTLTEGQMKVTKSELTDESMAAAVMVLDNNEEDSLEVSLVDFARASGADPERLKSACPRLAEQPFSSDTMVMKTINVIDGKMVELMKGAPEAVMTSCRLNEAEARRLRGLTDNWAGRGLKLLGLAYRDVPVEKLGLPGGNLPEGDELLELVESRLKAPFVWVGLVGIEDPVREGVKEAVETCLRAGITVKIITGDHKRTALAVARLAGVPADEESALEGSEIEQMDDAELARRVEKTCVFSRISPSQKLRIVRAIQQSGEVVAMIGDGVNDAPALKRADIGVVVGSATEVAKETADLVLLDSNFATIVAAVEEGRVIFQNIKKVVSYTLSNSFAEILLVFAAMMLGWPAPLAVAQILWVHLICDGPVDIVLGFEPKENGIMDEKPRPVTDPILDKVGLGLIFAISTTAAAGCLFMFAHYWKTHGSIEMARTLSFETMAVISLVYVFAYRSMRKSIFAMGHFTANKPLLVSVAGGFVLALLPQFSGFLQKTLGIVKLGTLEAMYVFGLSFGLLLMVEVAKQFALTRRT